MLGAERQKGFLILLELISEFKVLIVGPILFVLAILRGVIAADLRAGGVDAATPIVLQVFAVRIHQEEPLAVLRKHGGSLVEQEPADKVVLSSVVRRINREGDITAAFCGAIFAKVGIGGELFAAWFGANGEWGRGVQDGILSREAGMGVRGLRILAVQAASDNVNGLKSLIKGAEGTQADMDLIITAVGPDSVRLADPIIHYITGEGASISEIQMYDHDEEAIFAMLLRVHLEADLARVRRELREIGRLKQLSLRVWSPQERGERPRLAICATYRTEPARAVLQGIENGEIPAETAVMIGNRDACGPLAREFSVPWEMIGDTGGNPDEGRFVELLDAYEIDYVILARYMRVLPASICWKYAGGRIVNLHHGLLPGFPGMRPYHDAFGSRMLTFGATCHFIVPELDAGNQIIQQRTFTVAPGTDLATIIRQGQEENEPRCLAEGVGRVVRREVQLHFHRVIASRIVPR